MNQIAVMDEVAHLVVDEAQYPAVEILQGKLAHLVDEWVTPNF